MNDTDLITTAEAAQILRVSEETLSKWRAAGKGPEYARLGHRTVRYTRQSILAWMMGAVVTNRATRNGFAIQKA